MNITTYDGPKALANRPLELCQYIDQIPAVAELVRIAGKIPSGVLYSMLIDKMNLQTYNNIINILKRTRLVSERSYTLTWIGPTIQEAQVKRTFQDESFKQMQERLQSPE